MSNERPPSEAARKLAQTRLAIVEQIHRGERRHDPREAGPVAHRDARKSNAAPAGQGSQASAPSPSSGAGRGVPPAPRRGGGWFARVRHGLEMWWRYHPAQMAVEIASPVFRSYARSNPKQLLAISMAAGALVMIARPWRLISVTTILIAVVKSSQLSHVLLSALSAADYEKDHRGPDA
ncbi:hypothetical protein [Ramlibacter sp.]|uniref:hypothetical protein n=1 Tax=Ramlibacter sp. TaxID=1917967 RepID=UPI003D0D552E